MTKIVVWYGQLISRPQLYRRGLLLVSAGVAWLTLFLAVPLVVLLLIAFASRSAYGEVEWSFTLENFRRMLGFGALGWSADTLRILLRSAWVGLVTTILCLALAYPLAFFLAARPPRTRYLGLTLVIIPFCTNLVIRSYAWMLLLSPELPFARVAQWLGLIPPLAALYPSPLAVYIGMVSTELPFAVLPIYTNVERLDWSVVEAARDLYAAPARVFTHAILPQTLPGLAVAVILTFVPAMGMFVVPDLLGGAKYWLVGNIIQQQFGASRDWPFGAALSFGLMLLTFLGIFLLRRWRAQEELL